MTHKMTNDEIKEQYDHEGGPDLHPARSTDTGLTWGDLLLILAAVLVAAILFAR